MALANSRVQYFLPEQQAHLKKFDDTLVALSGQSIVNDKGQEIVIIGNWFPFGYINSSSQRMRRNDGSFDYITANATLEDSKDGLVCYKDVKTGEHYTCTSREFLDWLGGSYTTNDRSAPVIDEQIANQVENLGAISDMHKADYEDAKKKGWVSASDRKKSRKS